MLLITPQKTHVLPRLVGLLIAGLTLLSAIAWWQLMDRRASPPATVSAESAAPLVPEISTEDVARALSGSEPAKVSAVDEDWRLIGVLKEKRGVDVVLMSLNGERPVIATIGERLGDSQWKLKEVRQSKALFVDVADSNTKLELELPSTEASNDPSAAGTPSMPSSPPIDSQAFISQP